MELTEKLKDLYRSRGEREIAATLKRYAIPFQYEKETLVEDGVKLRIWYPDFYLPESKVYVEFFGRENDPAYNQGTLHKMKVYAQNQMDVVPVYPRHLGEKLESYLIGGIQKTLDERLNGFQMRLLRGHPYAPLPAWQPGYDD